MNMKRRKYLLLLVPFLLSARSVWAGSIETKERTARMACLSGDYAKGVAILSELFVDTKLPVYLYNQGRCFQQTRHYEDAVARFQEYLRVGKRLTDEEKAEAQKHIADCQDLLARQQGKTATPVAQQPLPLPSPTATLAPVPALAPQAPGHSVEQIDHHPAPGHDRTGLLAAGIVTASVGGAAVVAGAFLNLKVNSMVDEMQTKVGDYSTSKDSDRKTYQTIAWISYGLGAACIATGATLIGFGLKAGGGAPSNVALLPTVGGGQAGVTLTGDF
jgi:hypothetical protein